MTEALNPLVILSIGVVSVIGMIIVLRLNAFIALIGSALLVSLLSPGSLAGKVTRVAEAFGNTCAAIGIVIALAAVIGKCLMDSGSADRIVRSFLGVLGKKRAPVALMGSGFVLSIPVFFDTVFYLLVPLARSLYRRTKTSYVLYISAIAAGAALTHTLVPPTPGPLFMADQFGIDLGLMIMMGCIVGLPSALVGLLVCRLISSQMEIPMRPYGDQQEPEPLADENLPPLWLALLPVLLPIVLISTNTVAKTIAAASRERLLQEDDILDWQLFRAQLDTVGTDAETRPVRRIEDALTDDIENEAGDGATVEHAAARMSAAEIKTAVASLVATNQLATDPAFLGTPLSEGVRRLLDRGARELTEEDFSRYKKHYRGDFLAGEIVPERGLLLISQCIDQLPEADRERLNWLVLEATFPAQVRKTDAQKVADVTAVLGNANMALFISAAIAMFVLVRGRKLSLPELGKTTEVALMSGGAIILITAGGGAFGAMLREAGVKETVGLFMGAEGQSAGMAVLIAAAIVSSAMKFTQGSGTVAMMTTASMFAAMGIHQEALGCHPVYLALAIGGGSLVGSWMNDSGFWIFAKMSVLTETEGLKSWSILLAALGLTSLAFTLLLAYFVPMTG